MQNPAPNHAMQPTHVYEIRPREDKRGVNLISGVLPFGSLWYAEPNAINNAVHYAKFFSRSRHAVIRVYDEAGNVIETHETAQSAQSPPALAAYLRDATRPQP
jgi:hypothetical protein